MPRKSAGRGSEAQPAARRTSKRKSEDVGGDLHGRAGESLPTRERATVGTEPDWERTETPAQPESGPREHPGRSKRVVEIEYERGPGSRFQVEGRDRPRSKHQNKTKGKT